MRKRLTLGLIPALLAGAISVAAPPIAMAANGITETGTTTYQVLPAKNVIHVTIALALKNTHPNGSCGPYCTLQYYYTQTSLAVEAVAGPLTATSNGGKVKTSVSSTGTYYRDIDITYPAVYYGQTRKVTISYDIPAGPRAPGGFRALQAYASLCMIGHGFDSGVVQAVLPTGLSVDVYVGSLPNQTTVGSTLVVSSGSIPSAFAGYYCLDADDSTKLSSTPVTAGGQAFTVMAWPEDPSWSTGVQANLTTEVKALQDLTGLTFPGGTLQVQETAGTGTSHYSGFWDPITETVTIRETAGAAAVAHELSHVWFNDKLFADTWAQEGFAQYSEKAAGAADYTACKEPGAYPGAGSPDLITWKSLDQSSTTQDENVATYQYDAACYVVTTLADAVGPANLKKVLAAAAAGENAYAGSAAGAKASTGSAAITSRNLLDLIDERGMVPAGVKDLDQAQKLMARYGVLFDTSALDARSKARATYHGLATAAGKWALPSGVRSLMSSWDFAAATTAMATTQKILDLRKSIESGVPGFTLDGTDFQKKFEAAASQKDLDSLLALMQTESGAAAKVGDAAKLSAAGRNPIEAIGLLGSDTGGPLANAKTALAAGKTDDAASAARSVTDTINGAMTQGLIRLGVLLALLLAIGFIGFFVVRRRRQAAVPTLVLAGAEPAAVSGGTTPAGDEPPPPPPPPASSGIPPADTPGATPTT